MVIRWSMAAGSTAKFSLPCPDEEMLIGCVDPAEVAFIETALEGPARMRHKMFSGSARKQMIRPGSGSLPAMLRAAFCLLASVVLPPPIGP